MKKDYTHICVLLDKSYSMLGLKNAVIEGVNGFLDEQAREKGKCTLSLIQFDYSPFSSVVASLNSTNPHWVEYSSSMNGYDVLCDFADIASAPRLNENNFVPRGYTAYLDALGKCIQDLGESLSEMPENDRPEQVIVVVYTDGQENASCKFTKSDIKKMIEHQEQAYNWKFSFLGANMDAVSEGESLGITKGLSATYNANSPVAVASTFSAMSSNIKTYRNTKSADDLVFSAEQLGRMTGDDENDTWKKKLKKK